MHHPTKYFTLDFCTITTCCCHDTHYTPRTHTPHTFYYPARRCTTCRTHLELLYSTLRQYPVHKHATTASVDQHPNRAANVDQRTEFSQSPRRYRYPGSAALVQIGILKMLLLREELSLIKQKKIISCFPRASSWPQHSSLLAAAPWLASIIALCKTKIIPSFRFVRR